MSLADKGVGNLIFSVSLVTGNLGSKGLGVRRVGGKEPKIREERGRCSRNKRPAFQLP
jgi:hypothetical protein